MTANPLSSIAVNASRLVSDARLLFDNGRLPSSLSMSVLALEETGKYYMLSRERHGSLEKMVRAHIAKQKEASWFLAEAAILAFFEILSDHGYVHKPLSMMTNLERSWFLSAEGRAFQQRLKDGVWPDGIVETVNERLVRDAVFADYELVHTGGLNLLKQAGFYCDANEGVDFSDVKTSKVTTEKWLVRAEVMVERALRDVTPEASADFFGTVLRDDLLAGRPLEDDSEFNSGPFE